MRSTPALQSRGGDGFSCECNRNAVARLPEHEVCGDCEGRERQTRPLMPAARLFSSAVNYGRGVKLHQKNQTRSGDAPDQTLTCGRPDGPVSTVSGV